MSKVDTVVTCFQEKMTFLVSSLLFDLFLFANRYLKVVVGDKTTMSLLLQLLPIGTIDCGETPKPAEAASN